MKLSKEEKDQKRATTVWQIVPVKKRANQNGNDDTSVHLRFVLSVIGPSPQTSTGCHLCNNACAMRDVTDTITTETNPVMNRQLYREEARGSTALAPDVVDTEKG